MKMTIYFYKIAFSKIATNNSLKFAYTAVELFTFV